MPRRHRLILKYCAACQGGPNCARSGVIRPGEAGGSRRASTPFGYGIFYDYWKAAAANPGIHDVDLYGGTKRSAQRRHRRHMSTEDRHRLSRHTTSKAGSRYLESNERELLAGYTLADRTTDRQRTTEKRDPPL